MLEGGGAADGGAGLVVEEAGGGVDVDVAEGLAVLVGVDGAGLGDEVEEGGVARGSRDSWRGV